MQYKPGKYHILTFGCQANHADSSSIAGILEALGYEKEEELLKSDLAIVNTCSIRQKSEDKVYGLGKLLKNSKYPKPFVVMAGCMVGSVTGERQRYEFEELKNRTPWVDEYISPSQITELPNILRRKNVIGEWADSLAFNRVDVPDLKNQIGYVNISFGCDNFCRFCVVPYARGKEISRTQEDILKEVKHLISRGFSHIMLCGQNVNSWGLSWDEKFSIRSGSDQKLPFASLLRVVHSIDGLEKLSFISSNPFDFTSDLIDAIKLPKIDNFLHIAVQSGNNDILKKMNRRHTIEEFISLLNTIKKEKPSVEFGTDIIVGFPGETKEQFMDTVKLFQTVKFNVAFISMYSQRKGTPAEKLYVDDVPLQEKKRRHAYLMDIWNSTKKG